MAHKLISKSVTGILILLVVGAMFWQVAPVSAGVTPTPTSPPTATATSIPPTATATSIPPTATATSIPPTATATSIPPTHIRPTAIPPTETPISPTATPPVLLPVTGGSASGPNDNNIEIIAVSLAGVLVILFAAISLVSRKSARTKTDN